MSEKEEKHFYGGQALIEGVMMRGKDRWAAAVHRQDGRVVVTKQPVSSFAEKHAWARWPLIRGNFALVDSFVLGTRSLIYSFNVLADEEMQLQAAAKAEKAADEAAGQPVPKDVAEKANAKPMQKQSDNGWMIWLSMIPAFALAIGLFVLLPAAVPDWLHADKLGAIGKNGIEAIVRIIAIVGYIAAISLMPDIRRVFEFHGAEHATINAYEAGEALLPKNILKYGPLHPRCGTSFLLLFVVVKLLLNIPLGWPDLALRLVLRLVMVIPAAAVSYEILRYGGRHQDSWFGRMLSFPGKYLQRLTTRTPDEEQIEMAVYALAAVADEVDLPEGWPEPCYAGIDGKIAISPGDHHQETGTMIETPETAPETPAGD